MSMLQIVKDLGIDSEGCNNVEIYKIYKDRVLIYNVDTEKQANDIVDRIILEMDYKPTIVREVHY
jgi:hypothetical protein